MWIIIENQNLYDPLKLLATNEDIIEDLLREYDRLKYHKLFFNNTIMLKLCNSSFKLREIYAQLMCIFL
jgi:hypothetical protein